MNAVKLLNPKNKEKLVIENNVLKDSDGNSIPMINGVYKFVETENYTDNFGYQWNKFVETQIDRRSNINLSKQRFFQQTKWEEGSLEGKNILEAGSGAGRFSQIILDHTKANLYSLDYSNAVEANYKNNGPNDRLKLFQASIYEMPFEPASFDKVICFGVLQHTPDVELSVKSLIEMAKPGAEIIVDFYPIYGWWTKVQAKYILRPITKKMSNHKLYEKIDKNVDWMIKLSRFFTKIGVGKITNRFIPICDITGTLPKNLDPAKLREFVVLDTFDMFSPQYDQPQKINTVVNWFKKYGMKDVWGGTIKYDNFKAAVVKGIKE